MYDSPYALKTYKYPEFKYVIMPKYENVCDIPYTIKFVGTGGDTLATINYAAKKVGTLQIETPTTTTPSSPSDVISGSASDITVMD